MRNFLHSMIEKRQLGIRCGIPSFCCANKIVIEAILEYAKKHDIIVLIEATSNQVNQDLGYTGMTPMDFKEYVFEIADRIHLSQNNITLGGDHMGPLPWVELDPEIAMNNAEVLVRDCVKAGYTKIHLDTSMPLRGDGIRNSFNDEVIATRTARLYSTCEEAYEELKKVNPDAIRPVYVIGSEVPTPGGVVGGMHQVEVTNANDFENSLLVYKKVFSKLGMSDAWEHIVAIVVQPGVEFANQDIQHYSRDMAKSLCNVLAHYPDIVFEGHSTDFQTVQNLRYLVEDGFGIIKVGPALTFALREALFSLEHIERELISDVAKRSNFMQTLENAMKKNPVHWSKHYNEVEHHNLELKYSLSDRSRYYLIDPSVDGSITKLIQNLKYIDIPLGLLRQYMPEQYRKVCEGRLELDAFLLIKDNINTVIEEYQKSTQSIYLKNG